MEKRGFVGARMRQLTAALFGSPETFLRYYSREDWRERRVPFSEWVCVRWSYLVDRLFRRVPAKLGDSYLTHIPVLIGISRAVKIRKVLELGCGPYSTLIFLDQDVFPALEQLDSIENCGDWAAKVLQMSKHDRRLSMRLVDGPIADRLGDVDLGEYDLVFVDDALSREERCRTIAAVGRRSIVVIHDYDIRVYRRAARCFRRRYRYTALYPNTGVAWNGNGFCPNGVKRMNSLVSEARRAGCVPAEPKAAVAFYKHLVSARDIESDAT